MSRAAIRRFGASAVVAMLTVGLVHLFLVQVPTHLIATKAPKVQVLPLATPDLVNAVETTDFRPRVRRSGAGAAGPGIPAAPVPH